MTMQRFNPFSEIRRMEDRMARLWGGSPSSMFEDAERWTIPLDVREHEGNVVIEASVPGVHPDKIDVSIEDDVLTIRGESQVEREQEQGNYLLKERREGLFYRAIRLPDSVNSDEAASEYKDGIVKITLPKLPQKQPRKIEVKSSGESEPIKSSREQNGASESQESQP